MDYTITRTTRASEIGKLLLVVVAVLLISLPYWAGRSDMRFVAEVAYFIALAQMWNLLAGYAGLVSVGQQAFVGLGGYLLFALAVKLGIPPISALFLAGLLTAVIAIPTAFVVFRLRGAYFAIGTWVVAEVFRLSMAQVTELGGGSGMSLPASLVKSIADSRTGREMTVYYLALGISTVSIAVVYFLLRFKTGLALTAIRDSEEGADSLGVSTFRTKFFVYVLVAGITGLIGALIFLQKLRISPDAAFSLPDWTVSAIFIVVIGGIGTLEGPILGALVFFALRAVLADYGSIYLIVMGAIAIAVMLRAPRGLWGLIHDKTGWQLFPVHRTLHIKDSL